MIVVDASVIVAALADDGDDGEAARARLRGAVLAAPHLLDLEVLSAWRRLVAAGRLGERRVDLARADLRDLPLLRVPLPDLLDRCWQLRANLTVYDAAYVAAAELLRSPLLTADVRLAGAPGIACEVEVLG